MALNMKTFTLSDTNADLLTVPSGKVYVFILLVAANTHSAAVGVNLSTVDSDNSSKEASFCPAESCPVKASLSPMPGKLVLCAGDKLRGFASVDAVVEVTASWLETVE